MVSSSKTDVCLNSITTTSVLIFWNPVRPACLQSHPCSGILHYWSHPCFLIPDFCFFSVSYDDNIFFDIGKCTKCLWNDHSTLCIRFALYCSWVEETLELSCTLIRHRKLVQLVRKLLPFIIWINVQTIVQTFVIMKVQPSSSLSLDGMISRPLVSNLCSYSPVKHLDTYSTFFRLISSTLWH